MLTDDFVQTVMQENTGLRIGQNMVGGEEKESLLNVLFARRGLKKRAICLNIIRIYFVLVGAKQFGSVSIKKEKKQT